MSAPDPAPLLSRSTGVAGACFGADISGAALAVAQAERGSHDSAVASAAADLLRPFAAATFDIVASNPPYVALDACTRCSERSANMSRTSHSSPALTATRLRRLIEQAACVLKSGGWLVLELGFRSLDAVRDMLSAATWTETEAIPDLAGMPRVLATATIGPWRRVHVRTVFHVDMDAFFVSVEELFHPELKGKPVVVGGKATNAESSLPLLMRRASSACTRRCRCGQRPGFVPMRFSWMVPEALPRILGQGIFDVLRRFSPKVEMASIDEAYLDVTGTDRLLGPAAESGPGLHDAVKAATGLNCSIGIASSRLVAKIASDAANPTACSGSRPDRNRTFLAPLEIRKVPGVGCKDREHICISMGFAMWGSRPSWTRTTWSS